MRGESHVCMNVTAGAVIAETCLLFEKLPGIPDWLKTGTTAFTDFMLDGGTLPLIVFLPICILLYLIGALLPDIDTPYSTLGRIIYIPVEHRTWTHALWFPVIFCIAGIWVRPLLWLGIGVLFHDCADFFSASGLQWFYPIKLKGKHKCKLYHTGHIGERVIVIIAWVVCILYTLVVIQLVWHVFDFILAKFV